MQLLHSASLILAPSPAIEVYPARRQQEEQRDSGQDGAEEEAGAADDKTSHRSTIRRRRANHFRSKDADASSLFSSSAGTASRSTPRRTRTTRSTGLSTAAAADTTAGSTQSEDSTVRSSPPDDSHSSYSSSSSSARPPKVSTLPSSAFASSSVSPNPSFGIQQVLAFVYSYLPKPTPAQIAVQQQNTQYQPAPQPHTRQPHSSARSHASSSQQQSASPSPYHSSTTDGSTASTSTSTSVSPTSLFSSPLSVPAVPPSPPPHPVSVYDVSSRSIFNDYVVVLMVSSSRQMSYLSSSLYKHARASNAAPLNRGMLSLSGRSRDDWQSVDLGSVVVHIFNSRAKIAQPGLDYHPEAAMDESLALSAGGMWGVWTEAEQPNTEQLLARHAVIDNIERQFGDLVVPLDKFSSLQDYSGTEAGQRVKNGEEETMLVNDTPPNHV